MKNDVKTKNKEKKFKLFDMNKDGKGVYEFESRKPTLKFFFILLKRKFSQLLQLNLMMLGLIIPLIVIAALYFMGTKTPTMTDPLYAPLYGISKILQSPALSTSLDLVSTQMEIPVFSPWMNILMIAMMIFLFITFGWQNAGSAYVLRGLFRGDAVFVFTDYFYAIKKNFKQAFFIGILDFVCCAVLIIDFLFFFYKTGSFAMDFMYFTIFAIALIYIIMRFYIYQLMITFDLSVFKILKNALIFTILGIKRNILGFLGILLLIFLNIALIVMFLPLGISIFLVLPFVYIFSFIGFITTYAAYPVIDRYMIEPYENLNNQDGANDCDRASEE